MEAGEPKIERSLTLQFIGDWGQANFHRICSWLSLEFCTRAGPRSRVAIWNIRGGGIEAVDLVQDGEADLSIVTPAMLMPAALDGRLLFASRSAPNLRSLGVLPQDDRMVLALDPKFGISTFAELRAKRPPLRIAAAFDDGTNFIGHVARLMMAAHGIDEATLNSWGGGYVTDHRPPVSIGRMVRGEVDGLLQEAVMTPGWAEIMEGGKAVLIPAEAEALRSLGELGFGANPFPPGYWAGLDREVPALDFSDFLVLVRDDMPDDVAHLLTWCLVEQRSWLERQYRHIPQARSPLTYPLVPERMARPTVPLHRGAHRYYANAGLLQDHLSPTSTSSPRGPSTGPSARF
jgi:uncharacterized protein